MQPAKDNSLLVVVQHVWLIFVVVTLINAAFWRHRSRVEIARNPTLESGYRRLIRGFLIYGNIPWLILGAALELPHAFPGLSAAPFFIAFAVTIPVYWILTFYWLFYRNGAEDLAAHPGMIHVMGHHPRDPRTVKQAFLLLLLPGVIGILLVVLVLVSRLMR